MAASFRQLRYPWEWLFFFNRNFLTRKKIGDDIKFLVWCSILLLITLPECTYHFDYISRIYVLLKKILILPILTFGPGKPSDPGKPRLPGGPCGNKEILFHGAIYCIWSMLVTFKLPFTFKIHCSWRKKSFKELKMPKDYQYPIDTPPLMNLSDADEPISYET